MSAPARGGERSDAAASLVGITTTALSLSALLRHEAALIEAGRYGELRGLCDEKRLLTRSLIRHAAELQVADWQAALARPDGATLAESIGRLDEALRADMEALQRALVAADRVARIVGAAPSSAPASGYGPGGEASAAGGRAIAMNDRA